MVTAIVLAGGKGKRMNHSMPKQYIAVEGYPLLYYTVKAFQESDVDEIILVVGNTGLVDAEGKVCSELEYCADLFLSDDSFDKLSTIVLGGKERYDSVIEGLKICDSDPDYVCVHDGARAAITPELINRCIEDVQEYGSSVLAVQVKDTIKIVNDKKEVVDTPDRNTLWQIQTPQCFDYKKLVKAYMDMQKDENPGNITDDAMVMERYSGDLVHITEGDYSNIKVTTEEDLKIIENFLKKVLTK